jgi:soluble lytic murein transglycosylase-like protein
VLLVLLAGAAAFYVWARRNRDSGATTDVLEEVVVTAKKISGTVSAWLKKVPVSLQGLFAAARAQYGLPPHLLEAVAYRESRFRPEIISGALRSAKGAVGIMQIMPRWHPQLGEAGALDATRAIPYAAKYLRQLYNQFGDWKIALAAYNWGPGNQQQDLLDRVVGNEWPTETRNYVAEISANAGLA